MPSSEKTAHLGLNKWHGSDKPKKDDFNADNGLLDRAYGALHAGVDEIGGSVEAMADRVAQIESGVDEVRQTAGQLSGHTQDLEIHVTNAERSLWNAMAGAEPGDSMLIETYVGTGTGSRRVPLTRQPKFGLLFAVGKGAVEVDTAYNESTCYFGYFSAQGCSALIDLDGDGITVSHTTARPTNGHYFLYNEKDQTYVCVYWPQ